MNSEPEDKTSISEFINADNVLIIKDNISKNNLIEKLVDIICRHDANLNRENILQLVLKREEGISTTLDTGLSIPHARLENIDDFKCAFAVLSNDALLDESNGIDIKAVFLFISPANSDFFKKHLKLLSSLAETFQPQLISDITKLENEQEVFEKIASISP